MIHLSFYLFGLCTTVPGKSLGQFSYKKNITHALMCFGADTMDRMVSGHPEYITQGSLALETDVQGSQHNSEWNVLRFQSGVTQA